MNIMAKIPPDIGQLGEVIYSVLPEIIFQKLYGKGWVLMDGREITGSALHKLTKEEGKEMNHIPNGVDMFVRGKSKEREIGSFQADATKMPTNKFKATAAQDGEHIHKYNVGNAVGGHSFKTKGGEFWHKYGKMPTLNTQKAGKHTHAITISGGDPETRPKNIALYIYIKIN